MTGWDRIAELELELEIAENDFLHSRGWINTTAPYSRAIWQREINGVFYRYLRSQALMLQRFLDENEMRCGPEKDQSDREGNRKDGGRGDGEDGTGEGR